MKSAVSSGAEGDPLITGEPPSAVSLAAAANVALIGLFVLAMLVALSYARGLIVPVFLAVMVATILGPLVSRLKKRGIPRVATALGFVALLFSLIAFLAVSLTTPLSDWMGKASELGTLLRARLDSFHEPLNAIQEIYNELQKVEEEATGSGTTIEVKQAEEQGIVQTALGFLTPAASQLLIFFVSFVFYVIYKEDFKKFIVMNFTTHKTRIRVLRAYNDVEYALTRFFSAFSLINVGVVFVTTIAMWIVGMPNPLLWGVLAGLFNYLPYIGPAIMTISIGIAAMLTFATLPEILLPIFVYTLIYVIEGEVVTPSILGYSLDVNPFFLFLAVIFWTWMWGAAGAFLAVPITVITVRLAHHLLQNESPRPKLPG